MSNPASLQGKRVLVVEDDYYLATDEAAVLQGAGATVVGCTADAGEARVLMDSGPLDCALVDINLGFGPAFDTARELQDRRIPFLFTTGYDAAAILEEFRDIPRLEKPFDPQKLLAVLQPLV